MTIDNSTKQAIWNQLGASLDMLENAIRMCSDEHWDTFEFWHNAYHCIFWTDYYLTIEPSDFIPPEPFDLSEFDPTRSLPERLFTKRELVNYLEHCRQKAKQLITELTDETFEKRWINDYKNYSLLEILLYNLRHVQHHSTQLNLLLRQKINNAPPWVSRSTTPL